MTMWNSEATRYDRSRQKEGADMAKNSRTQLDDSSDGQTWVIRDVSGMTRRAVKAYAAKRGLTVAAALHALVEEGLWMEDMLEAATSINFEEEVTNGSQQLQINVMPHMANWSTIRHMQRELRLRHSTSPAFAEWLREREAAADGKGLTSGRDDAPPAE